VTLDGHDVRDLDPHWLRGTLMGYINQEPVLFSGSILDNIRYGNPEASMEDVVSAAKQANAHDFIQQFAAGYDTQLGERGVTVSGGQRQRIAIARALIKNPKVLILDEATSALDTESEHLVQEAIDRLTVGRTVIVIAHRLSTIQNADIIAVVQGGAVTAAGSHADLVEKSAFYSKAVQQSSSKAPATATAGAAAAAAGGAGAGADAQTCTVL